MRRAFVKKLSGMIDIEETDGCRTAHLLYDTVHGKLEEALSQSTHGCNLINTGFAEDVKVAAKIDCVEVVPIFHEGHIVAADVSGGVRVHA